MAKDQDPETQSWATRTPFAGGVEYHGQQWWVHLPRLQAEFKQSQKTGSPPMNWSQYLLDEVHVWFTDTKTSLHWDKVRTFNPLYCLKTGLSHRPTWSGYRLQHQILSIKWFDFTWNAIILQRSGLPPITRYISKQCCMLSSCSRLRLIEPRGAL